MKKFSIRRLVLFTFFAALVTLALNACGGGGGSTGSTPTPPATTANPIISSEGCDFTSVPLKSERCFGGIGPGCKGVLFNVVVKFTPDPNTCEVDGWMSVGSILHDNCCFTKNSAGYNCNNSWWQFNTGDPTLCKDEWQEAWDNTQCSNLGAPRQWPHRFGRYPAGNIIGDNEPV